MMIALKSTKSGNSGFTIVEMQIAMALATLMLVATISLYIFFWRSFATGNAALDVYSNSRIAMSWLSKDGRCATQIIPDSTITPGYTTSSSCVVLSTPSIAENGGVISIISPSRLDEIVYYVQNGNLHQVICPNAAGSARTAVNRVIAKRCNEVTFFNVNTATGTWTPMSTYIAAGGNLSTINNLGISLPINETILSLSGVTMINETATPTTVVKLRNK
jgi:Tfp pilus assembly protein PilW